MNERIKEIAKQAGLKVNADGEIGPAFFGSVNDGYREFAELIVRECIDKIETYQIPCGNSAAGEMACEWTYDALKSIRDDIKETFGVEG